MSETNFMTAITYNRLLKELKEAKKYESKTNKAIGEAAGPESDWHDNAAYDYAHTQYDVASIRLRDLDAKLVNYKIIKPCKETNEVSLGNTVIIRFSNADEDAKLTVLGPDDFGTRRDWISFKTPLASNLLGKKKGEEIELEIGGQKQKVTIKKILPGEFDDVPIG